MTNSFSSLLDTSSIVRKPRFWDWFTGSSLRLEWSVILSGAESAVSMNDSVDGGVRATAGPGSLRRVNIEFGDIFQFDHLSSGWILVGRANQLVDHLYIIGLGDIRTTSIRQDVTMRIDSVLTNFYHLHSNAEGSGTSVSTGLAEDTNYHLWSCEIKNAAADMKHAGSLVATSTTDLPTIAYQPCMWTLSRAGTTSTSDTLYYEAYNI